MPMKIIVAGSRTIDDYEWIKSSLLLNLCDDIEIVSGCAKGVDSLGETFAEEFNIPCKKFPADWNKFGKSAGIKRNEKMGDYADKLIAFYDGASKGTLHMINYMQKLKKSVIVYDYRFKNIYKKD